MNFLGPLHRYTFGIGWKSSGGCAHIEHKNSVDTPREKRRKRYPSSYNRVVPIHLVQHIDQFPYGGRRCSTHLKEIYSTIQARQLGNDELNAVSEDLCYQIDVITSREPDELDNLNMILTSLDQSPLKRQSTISLEEQTPASVRRLTSKLCRVVSASR
jgi:hypothetical protein